ncbi:hypothetical protein ACOMHN_049795 [Nucella lapillus]
MDKVLFLLCIPEEDEETDNAKKDKQNETKTPEKSKTQEQEGKNKAILGTADSVENLELEAKGTDVDCTSSFNLNLNLSDKQRAAGEDQDVTAADTIDIKPSQKEKDAVSSKETAPNMSLSSAYGNTPTETKDKQASAPELSSVATTGNITSGPEITEKEVLEYGQERTEADTAGSQIVAPATLPTPNEPQNTNAEGALCSDSSGLLTKIMIGQELTDDFWDFDVKEASGVDTYLPGGEDDREETQKEHPEENAEIEQQTTKGDDLLLFPPSKPTKGDDSSLKPLTKPTKGDDSLLKPHTKPKEEIIVPAVLEKTDSPDQDAFSTCPNTPEASHKTQDTSSLNAQKLSHKSLPQPESSHLQQLVPSSVDTTKSDYEAAECHDSIRNGFVSSQKTISKSKTDPGAFDVEIKPISDELSQKESASLQESSETDRAKSLQVSDKFIMIPVKEDGSVKRMIKSASTGEMKSSDAESLDKMKGMGSGRKASLDFKQIVPSLPAQESVDEDDTELMDFLPKLSLRMLVRNCLGKLGVKNLAWQKCTGDRTWQVTFIENSGMRCEDIILKLAAIGVGRVPKSSISVIPVSIHEEKEPGKKRDGMQTKSDHTLQDQNEEAVKEMEEKATEFQKSIKSRLVVRQVVKSVESNAEFTFDYVMLIILASVIAVMGLVENSSVVLVASMLISPLMGPILAGTFGTVIKNNALRNLGIRSELLGLGICLICGFLCGLVPASLEARSLHWRNADEWPTLEMSSRGLLRGLVVGMLIALPSGAGVALSVLGGNTGSLVGVAISASLLPPAVNAKETHNISEMINGSAVVRQETSLTTVLLTNSQGLQCPQLLNNEYVHVYFCNSAMDFASLGSVSLLLTVLNIFFIFIMGIAVLKIKEVAPKTSTQLDQNFFKQDVKIARESYTTTKGPQSAMMGKKWLEEYKGLKKQMELGDIVEEEDTIEFQHILETVENSPEVKEVLSRMSSCQVRQLSEEMVQMFHGAAVRHLEKHPALEPVYHTLGYATSPAPNTRTHNIYHTIRSPWNLHANSSVFMFPPSYTLHLDSAPPTPTFFPPPRLAPISEDKVLDEESDEHEHPGKRRPLLHIPKFFQVTQLEDEAQKESSSREGSSERSPSKNKQDQERGSPGKKGKKYQKRSPKKKAQQLTKLVEVDAEVPLLERGSLNASSEDPEKASNV